MTMAGRVAGPPGVRAGTRGPCWDWPWGQGMGHWEAFVGLEPLGPQCEALPPGPLLRCSQLALGSEFPEDSTSASWGWG